MTTSFCFSVPMGPDFDPRVVAALRSIEQASNADMPTAVALCDCSDTPQARALKDEFPGLISYTRHGPDEGQAAAIAEGWNAAPGDIVGWLNTDDRIESGALDLVAAIFEADPTIDVVCGQSYIETDTQGGGQDGGQNGNRALHPEVTAPSDLLYRSNIISQPSCFVRRAAIDKIGGINPDLHYTMDWDLWVRLMEAGCTFHYIDAPPLSSVYWGAGTKTGEMNAARAKELWRIVRRNCDHFTAAKTMIGFMQHHFRTYSN